MASKRCSKCGEVKPMDQFHRSAMSKDGRTSRCKTCRALDARLYAERRRRAELAAEERGAKFGRQGIDVAEETIYNCAHCHGHRLIGRATTAGTWLVQRDVGVQLFRHARLDS